MRRIVGSFGIAFVALILSTRGPLKIISRPLGMGMQLMALMALKKKMILLLKWSKIMTPCSNYLLGRELRNIKYCSLISLAYELN